MRPFLLRSAARARRGRPIRRPIPVSASVPPSVRPCAALILYLLFCIGANPSSFSQEPSRGLSKDQVLTLLKEDPAPRVQYLVTKYGIGFPLTPGIESDLRDAGATPGLMDLIRKLAPQAPAEVKPPSAPPSVPSSPAPPPILVIRARPGNSEVFVDDELRGQTGEDGASKLADLTPGAHRLRISLAGYRSYEVSVDLAAGETSTVLAELQPNPPPKSAIEEERTKDPPAVAGKPRGDPNDPLTPHAPGIYYVDQTDRAHPLVELEEASPASRELQAGAGSAIEAGFSYGLAGRPKWKSMIFGETAHLRIPAARPVFYFYFPTVESDASTFGLSHDALRHTSTPGGFVLVRLQPHKNRREIPSKPEATASVEKKDTVPFDYENLATGIYRVQLKGDLAPGEYGFLFGGMLQVATHTWLFDFGIDKAK